MRVITPCPLALAALPLAACALQMTIMSRDSGQTYKGVVIGIQACEQIGIGFRQCR
jgi:hypothetical protein